MSNPGAPPARRGPPGFGGDDASRYGSQQPFRPRTPAQTRKRMMAQGRKGHFMHDAKEAFANNPSKIDEPQVRAFLEGIFQRGTRQSTEDALLYLDTKVADETISKDLGNALANLIERYSFWR